MTQNPPHPGIIKAVDHFGSQQKLVAAIGCFSQQTISRVLNGDSLSPELAAAIHKATDGAVPKWELRPDLFDAPIAPGPLANDRAPIKTAAHPIEKRA